MVLIFDLLETFRLIQASNCGGVVAKHLTCFHVNNFLPGPGYNSPHLMNLRRLVFLVVTAFMAGSPAAFAQLGDLNAPIKIDKVETEMNNSPTLGSIGKSRSSGRDPKWLLITVQFAVNPEDSDFLDEAQFKVMVEGEDAKPGEKRGVAVLLTAEDSFVLLPKGKDNTVAFFLHPSVIERFGGEQKIERKNIHVEAYVKGQLVSSADKKREDDPNWFNTITTKIAGMVLTKSQSPWASTDAGKFPMAKLRNP
jgi:hypothetical protein